MQTITAKHAIELMRTGHCVFAYPRKGIVTVDGFKRYKATPETIRQIRNAMEPTQ